MHAPSVSAVSPGLGSWCSFVQKAAQYSEGGAVGAQLPHTVGADQSDAAEAGGLHHSEAGAVEGLVRWTTNISDRCSKIRARAQTVGICGGNPVDGAVGSRTTSREDKRRKKRGSINALRGREMDLDLPPLDASYNILDGFQLGILRQAIHVESRQRRAILTLPKSSIPPSVTKEDVEKQLELILKIDHLNVLTFHEACADAKSIHLVYDWPDGGLLVEQLTQYHEDVTEVHLSGIIREALSGLAAANHFNVHHLDWSLLCLFLGYKNRFSPLKLFGVGLAGVLIPLVTAREYSRGNKHFYVSPELLTENFRTMAHSKLHASDIWSLGSLLYMLCSGRPPFWGKRLEICDKIKKGNWIFGYEFDVISREAKEVIERMLTKKPALRPAAQELLKLPWLQQHSFKKRSGEGGALNDALAKLDHFARETHCKQTLARLLADLGLQESQYKDLEERFKELDLDGNGVIEVNELCEVASTLPNIDGDTIIQIITSCDRNGNMTVDISEFIAAVVLELEQKDERLLVKAFEKCDMNNDARITKGELFRILSQYSGTLDPSDISSFVQDVDDNKDHKIDYTEFKKLFPHMKEKDDEQKSRLHAVTADVQHKRKGFAHLQSEADKFMKALRVVAGKLTIEYARMQKTGSNEKAIVEGVRELHDIVKEFAGRGHTVTEAMHKKDATAPDKVDKKSMVTGLTVMNLNRRADETGAGGVDVLLLKEASSSGSDSGSGSGREQKTNFLSSQQGMSVAEVYVSRAANMKGKPRKVISCEANRRRTYLWQGGGDGMKSLRDVLYPCSQATTRSNFVDTKNRRNFFAGPVGTSRGSLGDGSPGAPARRTVRKTRKTVMAGGLTGDEDGDEDDDDYEECSGDEDEELSSDLEIDYADQGEKSTRLSQRGDKRTAKNSGDSPRSPADPDKGDSDRGSDDGKGDEEDEMAKYTSILIPWTTSKQKLKRAKEAMTLGGGAMVQKIGALTPEKQNTELHAIARRLLSEQGLSWNVSEELCDLHKLVRYKCCRSWLPPLVLLQSQLESSLDEQRVHLFERRAIHLGGLKFCVQLCERIMFSLTEFITWQQEAFHATWNLECDIQPPPPTKRFLPFREGDVDDAARTPRDEHDAECLAPAAHEVDEPLCREISRGATSDASALQRSHGSSDGSGSDSALTQSHKKEGSGSRQRLWSHGSAGMSQGFGLLKKLDRKAVRAKGAKLDPGRDAKLRNLARTAAGTAGTHRG